MERGARVDRAVRPFSTGEVPLSAACALAGIMPVLALLAWSYSLGSFAAWFSVLGPVSIAVLGGTAWWVSSTNRMPRLRSALIAGALGGMLGTVAYDGVRLPQVLVGLRPYIPIESYGILILNAGHSSQLTEFVGWGFNFINGIGFGIAYAMVALHRRWYWAVLWAFILETSTVVSPFGQMYQLQGKWGLIGLAYASHIAYGYALGKIVQSGDRFVAEMDAFSRWSTPAVLGGLVVALAIILQPWRGSPTVPGAAGVTGPMVAISAGRFSPKWTRVPVGGCATFVNLDRRPQPLHGADGNPTVPPGGRALACFSGTGALRVRTSSVPDAGGLVLADPALGRTTR